MTSAYPEHEKQRKILDKAQAIGEFLEWLQRDIALCTYDERSERFWPQHLKVSDCLAAYFEIDLKKIEEEKDTFEMPVLGASEEEQRNQALRTMAAWENTKKEGDV